MGSFSGPKIASNGLVLSIDANNQKSISPLGCTGFSGAAQLVKNLVSSRDTTSSTTGVKLDNLTFYTAFAIDYPEGSIGGDAAGRQGITPGFNVRTGTKVYDASRALHLWVWNNDTSSWVSDSYFHGLRLAGHCYDNYSGGGITGTELALFVSDYNTIKNTFPNCTYIVSGGHRADTYNVTVRGIFTDLGMPSGYIDSDFIGAPEWILVGKPGLKQGNAYGWVYQNYPTDTTQVAHLNFGLPIHQGTNNYLGFNGSSDSVSVSGSRTLSEATFSVWLKRNGAQSNFAGIMFSRGTSVTGLDFYSTTNNLGYHWNDAASSYTFNSGLTTPDGVWCMAVLTVTATTATFYLCQSSGITTATNTVAHASTTLDALVIGRDAAVSARYMNGSIAEALLYDRALTAAEVQQNFNAKRGRFGI
jgi:hypothetical protein